MPSETAKRNRRRQDLVVRLRDEIQRLKDAQPWRCFHCNAVFSREQDAAEHFGGSMGALAGCQLKGHEHSLLHIVREQEAELARHRSEDSDVLRAMAAMQSDHSAALRQAEETGFGRAVREMQSLAERQFGKPIEL